MNRTYHPRSELIDGYECCLHPSYWTWANMLSRCYNEKVFLYENYGGRGITVCEEWFHFRNFAKDMGPKPNSELTIDRINNELGYFKENCRWATRTEQGVNRRLFKNNTSGFTGIRATGPNGRYQVKFTYEKICYFVGIFGSLELAVAAREAFIELFYYDKEEAVRYCKQKRMWSTNKTGATGVCLRADGYYIVKASIKGIVHYVGYYKTLEEGVNARAKFIEKATS